MKTINKYLCAIAFLLGLFSCDSFLTTPPLDQISEDQWWNDKSQTEMMVKGAYNYIYGTEEVAYRDCFSDNGMRRSSAQTEIGNGTYTTQNSAVKLGNQTDAAGVAVQPPKIKLPKRNI